MFNLSNEHELKSTTITKKNFTYGLQSFNKNTLSFYQDLFLLIDDIDPIIQVDLISKTHFFITNAFRGIQLPPVINEEAFFYTLTKFFIVYGHEDLNIALYNVHSRATVDNLRRKLTTTLKKIIARIKNIEKKEREYKAFFLIYQILQHAKFDTEIDTKYDFRYYPNFNGLCLLLDEIGINIKNVKLIIDNEDKTYSEAKKYPFEKVEQADSKKNIHIRLADQLSGFIGRMIYALSHDSGLVQDKIEDTESFSISENKNLLNSQWFDINEERFELYKLI